MAKLIKVSGEELDIFPNKGEDSFSLTFLQETVDGYIQILKCSNFKYMIIDEEGKLKEKQPNIKATEMVRDILFVDDFIVGDVIICEQFELPD